METALKCFCGEACLKYDDKTGRQCFPHSAGALGGPSGAPSGMKEILDDVTVLQKTGEVALVFDCKLIPVTLQNLSTAMRVVQEHFGKGPGYLNFQEMCMQVHCEMDLPLPCAPYVEANEMGTTRDLVVEGLWSMPLK